MVEKIERTIQWYGLLKPPSDIKNLKWWRITADIIRPPLSIYRNDKYLTPYGFWGYLQCMYAGRVLHTYRLSYENEVVAYNINTDLFLHQSISCHLEAMLTSFVNLGLWVRPGFVFERNNPIKEWVNLAMPITEFRIKLLTEDTVFKFTYEYESQENCEVPDSSPPPPPPFPPPLKPPTFPPNTPNNQLPPISDAYDGENDGGLTYKPEEQEPPPTGDDCAKYSVLIRATYKQPGADDQINEGTFSVWGPVGSVSIETDNTLFKTAVLLFCKGFTDSACGTYQKYETLVVAGSPKPGDNITGYYDAAIVSITPIP